MKASWLVLLALLPACATARCVELVRATPVEDGMSLYVAADAKTVARALPEVLERLHYRLVDVRRGEVIGVQPFGWSNLALGVRVKVERDSLVRVTVRRRFVRQAPDLYQARDELVASLRAHFGAPR